MYEPKYNNKYIQIYLFLINYNFESANSNFPNQTFQATTYNHIIHEEKVNFRKKNLKKLKERYSIIVKWYLLYIYFFIFV